MNPGSAFWATILTELTMKIFDGKKTNSEKNITDPERDENERNTLFVLILLIIGGLLTYVTKQIVLQIIASKDPYLISEVDWWPEYTWGIFFFYALCARLLYIIYRKKFKPKEVFTIPHRFSYLECSVMVQTSHNMEWNVRYDNKEESSLLCLIEECLCGIGKEIVFDKTDKKIPESQIKLINKLHKIKEDIVNVKHRGDIEGYLRGLNILDDLLEPYKPKPNEGSFTFSTINEIEENDILRFAYELHNMLIEWKKTIGKFMLKDMASASRYAYERTYEEYKKLINSRCGIIDIAVTLVCFYEIFGAPRILDIKDPNIYNRPKRLAVTEKRTSFLYNPNYIEADKY